MKARIKETGEVLIVEEVSDKHVYVKMPCSIGNVHENHELMKGGSREA
nr:hypothetical protein [uncultured Porphyromonas sp.]